MPGAHTLLWFRVLRSNIPFIPCDIFLLAGVVCLRKNALDASADTTAQGQHTGLEPQPKAGEIARAARLRRAQPPIIVHPPLVPERGVPFVLCPPDYGHGPHESRAKKRRH